VDIPPEFRNTADGFHADWPHFRKFTAIRDASMRGDDSFPETYEGVADPKTGSEGDKAQKQLIRNFKAFRKTLTALFSGGGTPPDFHVQMVTLGANIRTCWQKGAFPKFSAETSGRKKGA
jgi:hypothetical protein